MTGRPLRTAVSISCGMKAHRAVADDAVHLAVRERDLRAQRLRDAGAEHAHLGRGEHEFGHAHLVEEVGPDGGVAAVDDQDGVVAEDLLAHAAHLRECIGSRSFFSIASSFSRRRASRAFWSVATSSRRALRSLAARARQLGEQRAGTPSRRPAPPASTGRLLPRLSRVDVDLDQLLVGGRAPVRRLAPPVGLAEPRAQHQHHVGSRARLLTAST